MPCKAVGTILVPFGRCYYASDLENFLLKVSTSIPSLISEIILLDIYMRLGPFIFVVHSLAAGTVIL